MGRHRRVDIWPGVGRVVGVVLAVALGALAAVALLIKVMIY